MQKGGTKLSYFLGHYTLDVFHNFMLLAVMELVIMMFGIACERFWVIGIIWSFADPLFIYVLAYTFIYAWKWNKTIVYTIIFVCAFMGNIVASTVT